MPPTTAPHLSIVIVAWRSGSEVAECVRSLAAAGPRSAPTVELIVVDNGGEEFPASEVVAGWPAVRLIRNQANRGFAPAANQGAAQSHGEIVLFLNPDTRAVDDPLPALLRAFELHPEAVAVAPRLLPVEGAPPARSSRFQLRRLPTLAQAARELLLLERLFPDGRGTRRAFYLDHDLGLPFPVEQPAAAALAVRREAFARLGGFDGAFVPAWFEDVDLCARLHAEGTILYWPESRFAHSGGAAARALGYDRFLPIYYRNARRYWRKHHAPASALTFRLLVVAGMVLRIAVTPLVRGAAGSRRRMVRAFWSVIGTAVGGDRGGREEGGIPENGDAP